MTAILASNKVIDVSLHTNKMLLENDLTSNDGRKKATSWEKRRNALARGEYTDCTFIVGPDDKNAEEIHALKFELALSSEYFESMLRSPLTAPGPIRIKKAEPRIFKLAMEFVHFHSLLTPLSNLEDAVLLARAADEYLIEDLGDLCSQQIYELLTTDTVWTTLSNNLRVKFVSRGCEKFLTEHTEKCISHSSFLGISVDAMNKFLQLNEMNIESEVDLIHACLRHCQSKNNLQLMRSFIQNLRLMTLTSLEDYNLISEILTPQESIFILKTLIQPGCLEDLHSVVPATLSPITEVRKKMIPCFSTLEVIPSAKIVGNRQLIEQRLYKQITGFNGTSGTFFTSCYLHFTSGDYILIKEIEVMCKVSTEPKLIYRHGEVKKVIFDREDKYDCNIDLDIFVSSKRFKARPKTVFRTNSTAVFVFDEPVFAPKGSRVGVSAILKESCFYRDISVDNAKKQLHTNNNNNYNERVFQDLAVFVCENGNVNYQKGVYFIKSLKYCLVED